MTKDEKIKNMKIELRLQREKIKRLTDESFAMSQYRDLARSFYDTLANCAEKGSTPTVSYWLKEFKRMLK